VVSDTWTGAVMTYNGARGNRAFAQIIVTNERPRAELRYRIDDGAWSAWSNRHTLVLPVLAVTGLQAEARALTGGGLVTPVPVEWREYAGNPTHGLVTLSNRYSNSVALTPFTQPGVHLYTVLANSGLARSEPGILTVSAPGVRGRVVAEGFQTRVPVWGAYAAPGTPGNTNALGWPDDPVATLSDEHGTLTLDRRPWAPAYVELERDAAQGEQRGYQFRSQMTAPVRGEQIFRFPVRTYRFGGQLLANLSNNVTGVPDAFATLVMHPGVRVHGLCNDVGSFSFGKLPQPWPADSETTGTYYFVFLKGGHNSVCIARTPAQIAAQRINERFLMPVSGATIQLCGTVRAATSLQPVPGALVHFGPLTVVADTNGEFCFSTLPKPYRAEPGSPSHVLVAEADEYLPTRNIYSNTFDGGNVDVFVNGGGHRVYGTIYDSFSGNIATGAAVRVPHPPAPGSTVVYGEDGAVFSSDSGFYTIDVPGGCEYVTIETRDRYEVVPIPPDHSGEDPIQLDIELLPEPALGFALVMFAAWRLRRAG
jgi:hypothetical protein